MNNLKDFLTLLITLKCPLECAHCIVDSSPRRTEQIELEELLRLIDEAASLGIKAVGFTGGDPFVRRKDLQHCIERTAELGMQSVVVTSGYWAITQAQAERTLEPFSEVDFLGISFDKYHEAFTPIDRVRNAVRAAKKVGIRQVELQVAYLDPSDIERVRDELAEDLDGVPVRGQVLWPVGRAAGMERGTENRLVPLDQLEMDCPTRGPVITPDGMAKGCCSSLLGLGASNPLILADVKTDGLKEAYKKISSNTYYRYIRFFGIGPLVELVRRSSVSGVLKPAYADVCHLCFELHSDTRTRALLAGTFPQAAGPVPE